MNEGEFAPVGAVETRAAREQDLDALAQLERECFSPPRGRPWTRDVLGKLLQDPKYRVWLGWRQNEIVSYAIFWSVDEEGEIDRIGVAPHWRRRGLGRSTVREVLCELRENEVNRVFLEVREDNRAACALYEELGFGEVGRRTNYYDDGTSARVMCWEVK